MKRHNNPVHSLLLCVDFPHPPSPDNTVYKRRTRLGDESVNMVETLYPIINVGRGFKGESLVFPTSRRVYFATERDEGRQGYG